MDALAWIITIIFIVFPFFVNAKLAKDKGRNVKIMVLLTFLLHWILTVILVFIPSKKHAAAVEPEDKESPPDAISANGNISISYRDAQGYESERDVTITSTDGQKYLYGFCHLKNEPRTFLIKRIISLIDKDTGEVVFDIPTYFKNKYANET